MPQAIINYGHISYGQTGNILSIRRELPALMPTWLIPTGRFESPSPVHPTSQIQPEQIDLPDQVAFTIPIEDGQQLSFTLPTPYAIRAKARAAARGLSVIDYFILLIIQELRPPESP